MRIVHVTQYFMPWLGYAAYYLPRAQLRAGHDVTVVASNLRWPGGYYGVLAQEGVPREMPVGPAVEREVPSLRLPVSRIQPKGLILRGLGRALRDLRPDVVISYLYLAPTTLQTCLLQRRLGFRCFVAESALPHQVRGGLKHEIPRRVAVEIQRRVVLPRIERLVCLAEGAMVAVKEAYRVPADRLELIPLGVDRDVFRPDPEARAGLRDRHGLAPDDFLVLYSGKIAPVKQVEVLIDAVREVPGATLWVVGKGEDAYVAELRQRAERAGIRHAFHPSVPPGELAAYFNAADICAWPADCTISHLEAAACGRPIIIPAGTGVDDRVEAGNGVMVPLGDVAAMASTIAALRDDPERRAAMSAAALAVTEARYGWPSIARRWDALISPAGG